MYWPLLDRSGSGQARLLHAALPVMDRERLAEQGQALLAGGFLPAQLVRFHTGGTSGQRLAFYRERASFARLALMLRRKEWFGLAAEDLVASVWPDPLDLPRPGLCGRTGPILARLEGRAGDVVISPSGDLFPLASLDHRLFADQAWVARVQYWQEDACGLQILVQPVAEAAVPDLAPLGSRLRDLLPGITSQVTLVPEIPREPNGKTPLLVSNLPLRIRSSSWENEETPTPA